MPYRCMRYCSYWIDLVDHGSFGEVQYQVVCCSPVNSVRVEVK